MEALNAFRHDTRCRLCGSRRIATVFRLAPTPPEDCFVSREKKHIRQPTYPLELAVCEECGYVHLPHVLNPEISYADYSYVSGVTLGLRNHYDAYADEIISCYQVSEGALVVDLGSNDGSMLAAFKRRGMRVLGVEPARIIADAANKTGLTTINDFFNEQVAQRILDGHGQASVVTANYMYANIDDVTTFTENAAKILAPDGIFVVQTGYHPEQMKVRMFDYIYHEHFSYFTVDVMRSLFARCGLELIDAQQKTPKGGSIRTVAQLAGGKRPVAPSVGELVHAEQMAGMKKTATYTEFAGEINDVKRLLLDLLCQIKLGGKRIVGFGASHSTTTLTYHFELAQFMEYLVDDNTIKHGLYSPGYHLPVYPTERLYKDKPDYVLLLAWQHQDAILKKNVQFLEQGGKFIVPLPEPRVV